MKSYPTITLISSSLPSLDPNGQPYSLVLRGEAAELGELESALSSNHPHTRKQLHDEFRTIEADDAFADAEEEEEDDEDIIQESITININDSNDLARAGDGHSQSQECKKRLRDDDDDDSDDGIEEDFEYGSSEEEQLLCYIPSIQCTCSFWNMDNIPGELFVTSIRVLFLADKSKKQQEVKDGDNLCNDVAIDGRYIALHAMDSDQSSENSDETVSHIYCQLSDPAAEDGVADGIGCQSALSINNIAEENGHTSEIMDEEEDGASGGDGSTVEVYFRPLKCENVHSSEDSCQTLFNALSQLASNLNAANDSNENAGGLFSMLSMMAGMSGFGNEMVVADDESEDDDMIIRYGGGNNFVENDDDSSQGAAEEERAAMLQRLDDMLVVPPELRISSDDEVGQFDDADEDDDVL